MHYYHLQIENTDVIITIIAHHYSIIDFDDFSNYNFYDDRQNTIAVINVLDVANITQEDCPFR